MHTRTHAHTHIWRQLENIMPLLHLSLAGGSIKMHLVLTSNFGNNRDISTIFGTQITKTMLRIVYHRIVYHTYLPWKACTLTFLICVKITPSQSKVHTVWWIKFILVWFTHVLKTCIPIITLMSFYLLILKWSE